MSDELRLLLVILAISTPVGLLLGLASRYFYPERAKKSAIRSLSYDTWQFYLFGCALFAVLALSQISLGRYWFAVFFAVMFILQLYGLLQSLRSNRDLTSKIQAIENWDPKKIWPIFPNFSRASKKNSK